MVIRKTIHFCQANLDLNLILSFTNMWFGPGHSSLGFLICKIPGLEFLCSDVRPRMHREGHNGTETGLLSLSLSATFPWPRLGREPLKVWNLGKLGGRLFSCSKFSDMMCRAERPPLSAAKCSESLTLTTSRISWNVVKHQIPVLATTGVIIFPWKFPWCLLFVCDLFGETFSHWAKNVYFGKFVFIDFLPWEQRKGNNRSLKINCL